jgi:hypothetical protein
MYYLELFYSLNFGLPPGAGSILRNGVNEYSAFATHQCSVGRRGAKWSESPHIAFMLDFVYMRLVILSSIFLVFHQASNMYLAFLASDVSYLMNWFVFRFVHTH